MAGLGGGATSLPFGPGGRGSIRAPLAGGPRQPPRGMLNLNRIPRAPSPKMDRGGPLLNVMKLLASRRGRG